MSLPGFSIRRPITTLMFFAGVLLFGVISMGFLRQELFPPVVYPKLTVVTQYANAAPEEIETLITRPIEEAVGSTPGVRNITSISREGLSLVIAEFGWDQNMDFAALGIREKIDLIKARLPRDSEEPTVVKFNPFELPVITFSIASDKRSPVELKNFATRWIKDEIEKINGVASASISGGADEEILVEVDQGRLKASELGILDIQKAIAEANLNYPGGTIKENFYEYLVRTIGEFKHIGEIGKISVGREDDSQKNQAPGNLEFPTNKLVLLNDVAQITRRTQERTTYSRYNGHENLTVSVQKQAQANTIQVVREIQKRLKTLQTQIPDDIRIDVVYNQALFIRDAINGVRDAAIQGGILAFLILFVFLRNMKSSLLVVTIIPVTILATFILMFFMNISVNVISLGGIALGVGMLVDNAVVVIENISRHAQESKVRDVKLHAIRGTEEVVTPLIASTLTTVMVFLPMIFVTGIAGQIFKELALVVVVTQIFSMVVAFTLLPMLIVRVLGNDVSNAMPAEGTGHRRIDRALDVMVKPLAWFERMYKKVFPYCLQHKKQCFLIVFVLFVVAIFFMTKYDRIVMPRIDQGQFMVKLDMPVGTRVDITNDVSRSIETLLKRYEDIESISAVIGSSRGNSNKDLIQQIGSHQAQLIVTLKDQRKNSTEDLVQQIQKDVTSNETKKMLRNGRVNFVLYESAFKVGGEETSPIVINVKGNSLEALRSIALGLQEKIGAVEGVFDVSNTVPESAPETKIIVNKDKAAFYRLSVTDLATAAHLSIKGSVASKFKEEGKEVDIRVVLRKEDREAVSELPFIQMKSSLGMNVPLDEVVTFNKGRGPSEIRRIDQERTIQVYAKYYKRSLNDINVEISKIIDETQFPEGYVVSLAGESVEVQESFRSLQLALVLSVILIYMIMASQFESYLQPFIIMFTVPLSLIGVSLALGVTGTAISVVVILGIILLGGIVVNNGIILIDFTNHLLAQGRTLREAIQEAGYIRMRPILMTASTTILGLIPLALGIDEGSKLQAPMAITVMGGMTIATFLTLVIIPAIYESAANWQQRKKKK